jgi:precorrin-3B synthase
VNAPDAVATPAPMRRGACPGLSRPMATGDGLLARLTPAGSTIALTAFAGLCAAAQKHGNGIIEITSRGSIQLRGLRAESAALFAAELASLGIAGGDGVAAIADPLSGLGRHQCFDAAALAVATRNALAVAPFTARLSAKVSVAIDGGGPLHLDALAADIRLRAISEAHAHVALGGPAAAAVPLGAVALNRAVECIIRLFETLAATAPQSRMRDAIKDDGLHAFHSAVAGLVVDFPLPATRRAADPIGVHRLSSGGNAVGLGLPFGHSDSQALSQLIAAAGQAGASGVRTAPGRALLLVGVPPGMTRKLIIEAAVLGFIADPADPRRRVVACAGAPICASGQIAARALAPAVAEAAGALAPGDVIHLSGCGKGCAHPAPAPLAVFGRDGRCDLLVDGALSDSVTPEALPAAIEKLICSRGGPR